MKHPYCTGLIRSESGWAKRDNVVYWKTKRKIKNDLARWAKATARVTVPRWNSTMKKTVFRAGYFLFVTDNGHQCHCDVLVIFCLWQQVARKAKREKRRKVKVEGTDTVVVNIGRRDPSVPRRPVIHMKWFMSHTCLCGFDVHCPGSRFGGREAFWWQFCLSWGGWEEEEETHKTNP